MFVEREVSLLAEVKRVCNDIKAKESSLDALFLSAGYIPFGGRESWSSFLLRSLDTTNLMQKQLKESTFFRHWLTTAACFSYSIFYRFSKPRPTTLVSLASGVLATRPRSSSWTT